MASARIAYDRIETALGPLWLAVSDRGLRAVSYGGSEERFREELRVRRGEQVVRDAEGVEPAGAQVTAYLSGERREFDLEIDFNGVTPFQAQVLQAALSVPYGRIASYGEIARRVGSPGASRAVGGALSRNPIPIVVPCHRVVASDGSLGGYSSGTHIKERLLRLEGSWGS